MNYDVLIVGGGPGGSTAGAFLAQAGKRVLLVEKEKFPRFHIGESLLPFGNDTFQASGAWPKIERAGFMTKRGAEFTLGNSARFNRFWFFQGLAGGPELTYQVERAQFDQLLLTHAAECGCEVREETAARDLKVDAEGVTVTIAGLSAAAADAPTQIRARWLIDATGRDTFAGRQLRLARTPVDIPKRIAVYAHFRGGYRNAGEAAGHITIVRLADGWFWFIPLADDKTSVGMVRALADFNKAQESVADWFARTVASSRELATRLQGAERLGEFHTTSDYTYRYAEFARDRILLIGDAAGFIDPIFSSGVYLAAKSAHLAATLIERADAAGRALRPREQRAYTCELKRMMEIYLRMIRMYYDNASFELFMTPPTGSSLVRTINSLLAGNTRASFGMNWRVRLFYCLCRVQHWFALVPRLDFREELAGEASPAISGQPLATPARNDSAADAS